jgi:MoaD family protein
MVEVLYFAKLKDITQKNEETFSLGNIKLTDLILTLIKKYPSLKDILWDENQYSLAPNIALAINHKLISVKHPQSLQLQESDTVAFLLPVSGG